MILVTVGTHPKGFDRLVRPMDELAQQIDEKVIIQYGSSSYEPKYADHFQWATSEQMEQYTLDARVLVTHAAAGTIILALRHQKKMVIVPRLKKYKEVIDDHQIQLANALHVQKRVVAVFDPNVETLALGINLTEQVTFTELGKTELTQAMTKQLFLWED